ncbi:hypothetical protein TNCV_2118021 [Trichonephila clavipes]|nr:hypothetical protein TNCV_2118021 [Trichonephila clavipes]
MKVAYLCVVLLNGICQYPLVKFKRGPPVRYSDADFGAVGSGLSQTIRTTEELTPPFLTITTHQQEDIEPSTDIIRIDPLNTPDLQLHHNSNA